MCAEQAVTCPGTSNQQAITAEKPKGTANETFVPGAETVLYSLPPLAEHEDSGEDELGAHDFKAPTTFYPNGHPCAVPFPLKLMEILSSKEHEDIITWTPSGLAFHIHKPKPFAEIVLPDYFKTKNVKFSSFVRKLNRWGFAKNYIKDGEPIGSYQHRFFQKGGLKLAQTMKPAVRSPPLKGLKLAQNMRHAGRSPPLEIKALELPRAKSPASRSFAAPSQVLPSGLLFQRLATQQGNAASTHATVGAGSLFDVNDHANAVRRLISQRGTLTYGSAMYPIPSGDNTAMELRVDHLLAQQQADGAKLQARERAVFDLEVKHRLEDQVRSVAPSHQALSFALKQRLGQLGKTTGAVGYGRSHYAMEAEDSRLLGNLSRQVGLQSSAYFNPHGTPASRKTPSDMIAAIELEVIRRFRVALR